MKGPISDLPSITKVYLSSLFIINDIFVPKQTGQSSFGNSFLLVKQHTLHQTQEGGSVSLKELQQALGKLN